MADVDLNLNRRDVLKLAGVAAVSGLVGRVALGQGAPAAAAPAMTAPALAGKYVLPPLGYAFDALEPFIDAQTMEIHHDKHHAAYVANLNKAMAEMPAGFVAPPVEELITKLDTLPEALRTAVRNNGGGHANHTLFWTLLKKNEGGKPGGKLGEAIAGAFGDQDKFVEAFTKQAMGVFGSGWAWLALSKEKKLILESTPNQDSPLMHGGVPLLGINVWEHAYYLKYQNQRADYVKAFCSVINWGVVEGRFAAGV